MQILYEWKFHQAKDTIKKRMSEHLQNEIFLFFLYILSCFLSYLQSQNGVIPDLSGFKTDLFRYNNRV